MQRDEKLFCNNCGQKYPIINDIPSFTTADSMFEGRYKEQMDFSRWANKWWYYPVFVRFNISLQRIHFLRKNLEFYHRKSRKFLKILDLGCGGGGMGKLLNKYGEVIGIDISFHSLYEAMKIYSNVVHCNANNLPFPDQYFDCIVSTDVLGHIPLEDKEQTFSEMYRVLRKDGLVIHSAIETSSNNVFLRFAKRYPDLFQKYHIDKHGHIGLELPSVIIDRLVRLGFRVLEIDKINALILPINGIAPWFDNEYKQKSKLINFLVFFSKILSRFKVIRIFTDLCLGIAAKIVNPLTPVDQTTGLLLCCKK